MDVKKILHYPSFIHYYLITFFKLLISLKCKRSETS